MYIVCLAELRLSQWNRWVCSWMMQSLLPLQKILSNPGMTEPPLVRILHLETMWFLVEVVLGQTVASVLTRLQVLVRNCNNTHLTHNFFTSGYRCVSYMPIIQTFHFFSLLFTKNWHRPSLGACSTRNFLNVWIF